jgi:anti-sigma factor RsiW
MATCDDVRPLLGAYADKELEALEADAVATHLEQCGRCRQTVRDQQRVQHVLASCQPPPVPDDRWDEIGKHLRAELEGTGKPAVLKTRPRIESLEPTPVSTPSLRAEELATPFARVPEAPPSTGPYGRAAPRAPSTTARPPSVTVLRVRPRRYRDRFGWVAHAVGAVAATLIMAIGMASMQMGPGLPAPAAAIGPIALAGPKDVDIMHVEMIDPGYELVVSSGDADDVVTVYVVPARGSG